MKRRRGNRLRWNLQLDGQLPGVLFYLGLRHNDALRLMWGDFDFKTNMVHIRRDVDHISGTTRVVN